MPFWDRPGLLDSLLREPEFPLMGRLLEAPRSAHLYPGLHPGAKRAFWRALTPARAGLLADAAGDSPYVDGPFSRVGQPIAAWVESYARLPFASDTPMVQLVPEIGQESDKRYGVKTFHRAHRLPTEEDVAPAAVADAHEATQHRTPQYFLRNIGRMEREADEFLQFEHRTADRARVDDPAIVELAEQLRRRHHISLDDELATRTLVRYAATTRRLLYAEQWTRYFGHDLSSNVAGPLWKYFPDDEAFRRYGSPESERLAVANTSQ